MTFGRCYDSTGTTCAPRAQTGTIALRDEMLARFPTCRDWGILNCRPTRSGSSLSTHGEGRGWDAGFPGLDHPDGQRLADLLVTHHESLGMQRVIWSDRQWDTRTRAWRPYGSKKNSNTLRHRDHVHAEQCWESAQTLTRAMIRRLLDGPTEPEEDEMQQASLNGRGATTTFAIDRPSTVHVQTDGEVSLLWVLYTPAAPDGFWYIPGWKVGRYQRRSFPVGADVTGMKCALETDGVAGILVR